MNRPRHFNLLARVLHWSMAVAILAMLFVGAAMVVSLRHRELLLDLHRRRSEIAPSGVVR